MSDLRLAVRDGVLVEVPCLACGHGDRNWLAVVEPDPTAPDGLARVALCPLDAEGGQYLLSDPLPVGTVIECGAQTADRQGRVLRSEVRYGRVVAQDERTLTLRPTSTPAAVAAPAGRRLGTPRTRLAAALAGELARLQAALEAGVCDATGPAEEVARLRAALAHLAAAARLCGKVAEPKTGAP